MSEEYCNKYQSTLYTLKVGPVANFAGYQIRVPGRYYPAGSG